MNFVSVKAIESGTSYGEGLLKTLRIGTLIMILAAWCRYLCIIFTD